MNGYELSRSWWNFAFENPEKVKPIHAALYFFAIEHCNRLGWKNKFGLPTEMAKDAIGVKSWHTYIAAFNDLIEWGFFELIERSKNQYSSNIIALIKFDKALDEALDKAMTKHASKHQRSTHQSNDSINKPITIELLNKETIGDNNIAFSLNEWAKLFFNEKFIGNNSYDTFDKLTRIDNYKSDEIKEAILWARNDDFWSANFLSPLKLRNKDKNGVKYIDIFLAKILTNGKNRNNNNQGASAEQLAETFIKHFGGQE